MKYYKNLNNQVFAYEADGSQDSIIPSEFIAITEQEMLVLTAPPPAPTQTQFTSLEFLAKFTEEEVLGVVAATLQSAPIKLWYDMMMAATYVDLEDVRTEQGLDALITAGLLATNRKAEILAL
jgi:hypothetical protein